jgi:hypothetical protein
MKTSSILRFALCVCAGVLVLAGCSGTQTAQTPNAAIPSHAAPQLGSGNIFWNKAALHVAYPSKSHRKAVLTYWAPDGYYTLPVSCKNGGRISATPHQKSGDPSGYMHVVYWFKAKTPGPDSCSFTAVLNNTGSPPIAIIDLFIGSEPEARIDRER